jgi:hypothetical protein
MLLQAVKSFCRYRYLMGDWPCEHECEVATVVYSEDGTGTAECIVCGRRWEPVNLGGDPSQFIIYGTSCTVGHGGVYFPALRGRGRACAHDCPLMIEKRRGQKAVIDGVGRSRGQ